MSDKTQSAPVTKLTLTAKGKTFNPRAGTHRHTAWTVIVAHAGKGEADAVAAINSAKAGSITGRNLIGWARKQGLIA